MQHVETNKRLISQKHCNCCTRNDFITGLDGQVPTTFQNGREKLI